MGTKMPALHVIVASSRPGANGKPIGEWFAALARQRDGLQVTLVDLAQVNLPLLDEPEMASTGVYKNPHTQEWSQLIERADAIVWVMPMYNGGFGAVQKNAIDFLYREWNGKPVGLVSYSAGNSGGRPAARMLAPVFEVVEMRPSKSSVAIARVEERIDASRRFHPTEEQSGDALLLLDELKQMLSEHPV